MRVAIVVSLSSLLAFSASAMPIAVPHEIRLRTADHPRWADPALDDSSWPVVELNDVPATGGIVILRARVRLDAKGFVFGHPSAVFFAAIASHELAWDGVIIGRGGRVGATREEEVPGPIQAHWVIPDRLATPGEHLVALRCSAHRRHFRPRTGYWTLLAGDYDAILSATRQATAIALPSLSGMLMAGLFSLAMFLADRRDRSFLLLGLVCLCGGALLLAESWRTLFGYTYDWHLTRLLVITALTALLNLAIVGFVIVRFPGTFPGRVLIALGMLLALSLAVPGWDGKSLAMFVGGLCLSTGWTLRAVRQGERAAIPALTGLGITLGALAWRPRAFTDAYLYLALDVLLACLLVAHALQVRRFRREHEEALVKSARLEIELLRRHIQPHFLMNTLTALAEWIEEEPRVAVRMIESLSDEFRILARISSRALIEAGEELALCRTHIEIMSRRRGRDYELEVLGVDASDLVPPAIFHTLVENAITHDESKAGRVVLRLSAAGDGPRVRYVFEAPGSGDAARDEEGTGLRYIRARLHESFGGDWSFEARLAGGVWRTEIAMPRRR